MLLLVPHIIAQIPIHPLYPVQVNKVLTNLVISHANYFGNEGRIAIAEALEQNGASKLAFMTDDKWSLHPSTTELNTRQKGIGAAEGRLLAAVLRFNSVLTTLNLWSNGLGDEGQRGDGAWTRRDGRARPTHGTLHGQSSAGTGGGRVHGQVSH